MNLLCALGIHRPVWQRLPGPVPDWVQVRKCTRCGRLIGRQHRG